MATLFGADGDHLLGNSNGTNDGPGRDIEHAADCGRASTRNASSATSSIENVIAPLLAFAEQNDILVRIGESAEAVGP